MTVCFIHTYQHLSSMNQCVDVTFHLYSFQCSENVNTCDFVCVDYRWGAVHAAGKRGHLHGGHSVVS